MTKPKYLEDKLTNTPETYCFRLLYWELPATPANIGWGVGLPCERILNFQILGTRAKRKKRFTVDAIYPLSELPEMNHHAIVQLVRALRVGAEDALGVEVDGIVANIIDWE